MPLQTPLQQLMPLPQHYSANNLQHATLHVKKQLLQQLMTQLPLCEPTPAAPTPSCKQTEVSQKNKPPSSSWMLINLYQRHCQLCQLLYFKLEDPLQAALSSTSAQHASQHPCLVMLHTLHTTTQQDNINRSG
jgi:hypothetical protein